MWRKKEQQYYDVCDKKIRAVNFLLSSCSGSVEVLNMALPGKFSGDFRAHLPRCPWVIDHRAYKLSKQMPEVLQFELLPRGNIWDEIFDNDFAFSCDISLYFFPGNLERFVSNLRLFFSIGKDEILFIRLVQTVGLYINLIIYGH